MSGIFSLTRNEIIKVRHQKGLVIFMCIILAFVILLPVATVVINEAARRDREQYTTSNSYSEYYNPYSEENYGPSEEGSDREKIITALRETYDDCIKFYNENQINRSDWRYRFYFDRYTETCRDLTALELLRDGMKPADILSFGVLYEYTEQEYYENEYYSYVEWVGESVDVETGPWYPELTKDFDVQEHIQLLREQKATYEQIILENNPRMYHEQQLDDLKTSIEKEYDEIKRLEAMYSDTEQADKDAEEYIEELRTSVEINEAMIPFYQFAYDNNISLDADNWQYNTISTADQVLRQKYRILRLKENRYSYTIDGETFYSYEEFDANRNRLLEKYDEAFVMLRYGLENNIADPVLISDSARTNVTFMFGLTGTLITIFTIILAGTTVASEFSSGTIRLLLIRPKKRYKILTSKLLCVLFYTLLLTFVTYVFTTVLFGVTSGGKDLFVPYMFMSSGGEIEVIPSMLVLAGKLAVILYPTLVLAAFALMLSVITTKSSLSTALPMAFYMLAPTVRMLLVAMTQRDVLRYTFVGFMDFLAYTDNAIAKVAGDGSGLMGNLFAFDLFAPPQTGIWLPITVVTLHLAAVLFVSLLVFNRKQIKS